MRAQILLTMIFCAMAAFGQDKGALDTSPGYVPDPADIAKLTAACGPDKIKFDVDHADHKPSATAADPGAALVYVIEEPSFCGDFCSATIKAGLDGSWVGANQGGSYFSFTVSPGEHHLCARWQSAFSHRSRLIALDHFTAEVGKTYYFRARVYETEHLGAHLDLDRINSDQGQLLVASYPLSIAKAKK